MVSAIGRVSPDGLIVVGVSRDQITEQLWSDAGQGFLSHGYVWGPGMDPVAHDSQGECIPSL